MQIKRWAIVGKQAISHRLYLTWKLPLKAVPNTATLGQLGSWNMPSNLHKFDQGVQKCSDPMNG